MNAKYEWTFFCFFWDDKEYRILDECMMTGKDSNASIFDTFVDFGWSMQTTGLSPNEKIDIQFQTSKVYRLTVLSARTVCSK